jgi:hypothetical protein
MIRRVSGCFFSSPVHLLEELVIVAIVDMHANWNGTEGFDDPFEH